MSVPALAAITLDATGGGVALVSRLMWRSFLGRWGTQTRLVTMFDGTTHTPTLSEKCRFGTRMFLTQAIEGHSAVLFAHLGLARVQNGVPATFRRPYGVFLHGIEAWRELTKGEERTLRSATLLLANSDYTAARVRERHPWIGAITVCPLAIPAPIAGDAGDGVPARPQVLMVGRMAASERYKGHDLLIEAWPSVARQVPGARLVIAGAGDDMLRLQKAASEAGLNGSVDFVGFVGDADLDALYRQSTVFAMPSRGEGFGLVYLEAMARGVPCVASTADAAREVVVDGVTGHLVDPDHPSAVAAAITHLLRNPDVARQMGLAGRKRAAEVFSYERFDARLQAAMDRLAGTAG